MGGVENVVIGFFFSHGNVYIYNLHCSFYNSVLLHVLQRQQIGNLVRSAMLATNAKNNRKEIAEFTLSNQC